LLTILKQRYRAVIFDKNPNFLYYPIRYFIIEISNIISISLFSELLYLNGVATFAHCYLHYD